MSPSSIQSSPVAPRTGWLRPVLTSRVLSSLTYPHGVDRFLEQFDPAWSVNEVRARLLDVRRQTADTVTVRLAPNANWRGFRPGQYLRLSVDVGGVRKTRCFSPANSAHAADGAIELTCKIGPASVVSRHLAERARPGDVLHLSQAEGQFGLPEVRPQRVLLISGGSGITPVMAMLRTLVDEEHPGRITFLHYARSAVEQLYAQELRRIAAEHPNVELLCAYTRNDEGRPVECRLQGSFSAVQLRQAVPDFAQAQTFLCGPPAMMERVREVYAAAGAAERLHQEHFVLAPTAAADDNATGEVRFARSERRVTNSGETLLDQAEGAGLKPEHGCRMGICHACTCRKTSGRVRDLRNGSVGDAGEEDIQLCISVPVGTVTLDL